MDYRYGILATALAVGFFALPASAAVSDVEGGTVNVNTTINKHYNEIDGGTNTIRREVTEGTRTVGKTFQANLEYKAQAAGDWGRGEEVKARQVWWNGRLKTVYDSVWTGVIGNYSSVDQAVNAMEKYLIWYGGMNDGRSGATFHNDPAFFTGRTQAAEGRTHVGTRDTGRVEDVGKQTTVLTRIESARTINSDPGSITIGDPDSIANAYAAQGNVTVDEVVDKYYDRTHYYNRTVVDVYAQNVVEVWQVNGFRFYSPIILDLDGDGKIEASDGFYQAHDTFSDKVAMFDFFGNGFPVLTEWVGANDGLLCRPTKDGKVTGAQLFGTANGMANGYEEMASLDADNSGALEGAELQGLYVWTDLNGNAIADKGELKSLEELGITSIKVTHNNYASTFTRNGQTYKTFDWWPNCRELRKVNVASMFE